MYVHLTRLVPLFVLTEAFISSSDLPFFRSKPLNVITGVTPKP